MEHRAYADSASDEPCMHEGSTQKFKSKNLKAERRRRHRISQRLLTLRSLVPVITNMKKETILEDAITYIMELQKNVESLSDQLLEMEASCEEQPKPFIHAIDTAREMEEAGIKTEVQVTSITEDNLWVKIIIPKRRCRFTKLLETLSVCGFELTDTSVTTFRGALLISSCIKGPHGNMVKASQMEELLQEIIKAI